MLDEKLCPSIHPAIFEAFCPSSGHSMQPIVRKRNSVSTLALILPFNDHNAPSPLRVQYFLRKRKALDQTKEILRLPWRYAYLSVNFAGN